MAKIKKKGTSGQAKNFITRTQAVRKLQISLPDFRRLCIFKGIYPREPRNKRKASKTSTPASTFYYTKDIQYLLHEPLLGKFRDHKALAKKISRALGRGEVTDAARLERTHKPRITLDHIIKERYPTFVDALRDLDDALSMLFLFANLPSNTTIPPKTIALCQRLCHEFEHYLITTHTLRKSFLSIKGIYYEATIQGQDILWLVPYKFVQRVTSDVDFRIMATFVEFYTTLLGFVNFRLYSSIGLVYPPKFNATSDEKGGELGAYTLQGPDVGSVQQEIEGPDTDGQTSKATERAQAAANSLTKDHSVEDARQTDGTAEQDEDEQDEPTTAVDTFTAAAPDADTLPTPQSTSHEAARLFAPHTFYLSRETPRHSLEFLLRAFGCRRIGWPAILGAGAYTTDESDPAITHQVVDRPPQLSPDVPAAAAPSRYPGRTYVQPQWVWDSVNAGALQRPALYAPGATLPPHLSPWARPSRGAYDPTAPLPPDEEADAEAEAAALEDAGAVDELDDSDAVEGSEDSVAEPDGEMRVEDHDDNAGFGGFSSEDEAEEEAATARVSAPPAKKSAAPAPTPQQKQRERQRRQEAEELERRKMMMPRRKRKLYERMAHGNARRDEERARLEGKRRRIERERAREG